LQLRELGFAILEYRKTLGPENEREIAALQKRAGDIALLVVQNDSMTPNKDAYRPLRPTEKEVLPVTKLLISAGCESNLDIVFQKILPGMKDGHSEPTRMYLEERLLPVIEGLAEQFKEASMEWPHPSTREFISKILNTYIRDVLGRKSSKLFPPFEVLSFRCAKDCIHCLPLRSFYQDSSPSLDIQYTNSDVRYHITGEIDRINYTFQYNVRFPYKIVKQGSASVIQVECLSYFVTCKS
jgi:hypothetical protein